MINDHTLGRFQPLAGDLVKPLYDYSFANLPATLHFLLTGETLGQLLPKDCFGGSYPTPEKIILLFVDSFGWRFWQQYSERSETLQRIESDGVVTPISALFPSTTSASVSTLNLGQLPSQHGVYEWNLYVPSIGQTIQSLPFRTLGSDSVPCESLGHDIGQLVRARETIHHRLTAHGVRSIQLAHRSYAHSSYNRIASAGAEVVTHNDLPEALAQLKDITASFGTKALINLYWAGLDTAAHLFGPCSPEHEAEIFSFWSLVDSALRDIESSNTMLMVIADHGQIAGNADDTIYLNEICPALDNCLAVSTTGVPILPNGAPRDMFLHLDPERQTEAVEMISETLQNDAYTVMVDEAIQVGLFGNKPVSIEARKRMGDLLVLPYRNRFVWWREAGVMDNPFHGHHGGLGRDELISIAGFLNQV
jgi:Type I phosphodiesterase / nucleotide pyrophosphatase